jgi:hypothetical protein
MQIHLPDYRIKDLCGKKTGTRWLHNSFNPSTPKSKQDSSSVPEDDKSQGTAVCKGSGE